MTATAQHRRDYRRRHPERVALANRRVWSGFTSERRRAYQAVQNAVRHGGLIKEACEACGDENTHAHHDDYCRPLEVRWLCRPHHAEAHKSTNKVEAGALTPTS